MKKAVLSSKVRGLTDLHSLFNFEGPEREPKREWENILMSPKENMGV